MTPVSRRRRYRLLAGLALVAGGLTVPVPAAAQAGMLPDTLDIGRAIRIALAESPVLRLAQVEADQAGADRMAAWGAFLPTGGVGMTLSRSAFSSTTYVGEEGLAESLTQTLTSTRQSANQGLNARLTLFDGGRRFVALSQTAARVRAAQRRYDDRQRTLIVTVRREFLEALRRQQLLALTRTQIADRELELDIARRRYEIAAVERTDVLAAESELLNARITLLGEQNQLRVGLEQLAVSMGLPPDTGEGLVLTGDEGMPAGIPNIEAIVRNAVTSDPELVALEADRAAALAGLWEARTGYLPRIELSMSWNLSENFGPDASFWQFRPGDSGEGLTLSASWNVFDGFAREQRNAQASAARRQAEEDLRARRLEIERDVRRYAAEIQQLGETIDLLEQAFEISRERLEMEQERYRLGTGSYIELQQAVSQAQFAETSLIQRRYDYLISWSNLAEYVEGG